MVGIQNQGEGGWKIWVSWTKTPYLVDHVKCDSEYLDVVRREKKSDRHENIWVMLFGLYIEI